LKYDFCQKKIKIIEDEKINDIILQCNDGPPKTLMNCGHAVSANSLYKYMKNEFMKPYIIDIPCPDPDCKKTKIKWDWNLCVMVANLNVNELNYFENIRLNRQKNLKKCPSCNNLTSSPPDNWKYFRVNCGCNLGCGDFCWNCGCKWKGLGNSVCGNDMCDKSELNNLLEQSAKSIKEDQFPSIRACPSCETIIEHNEGCKHMCCSICGKSFCFRCLSIQKDNGNWICGSTSTKCDVVPAQNLKAANTKCKYDNIMMFKNVTF